MESGRSFILGILVAAAIAGLIQLWLLQGEASEFHAENKLIFQKLDRIDALLTNADIKYAP